MYDKGFILVSRKLLSWEWYKDINTKIVFLHCLLKANYKDGKFQGMDIPRGSFVSSYQALADELSLSVRNVRTAINHLKSTGEVTSIGHAKFTVFTVNNYNLYQTSDMMPDKQVTNNRQASDKQVTTIEKSNNSNKSNNLYISPRAPTLEEVESYFAENGLKGNARDFFDYHNDREWKTAHGTDVTKDWKKRAKDWKTVIAADHGHAKTRFHNFEQRSYEPGELNKFFANQKGGVAWK